MNLYYSFNEYLREIFKERVHRISLNAGFSCPNLDGTLSMEGCIYCNNLAFSHYVRDKKSIEEQIEESIDFYTKRKIKKFIAYFQSFTNTYGELEYLESVYNKIRNYPQIVGLFISTRPDCIDESKIKLISSFKKDYLVWIEYGLQTTHNDVLKTINRNHTYEDFLFALNLTRKFGINVGVHIIIGLPFLNRQDILQDAINLSSLDIQGIKFHVLHVLKGTQLERWYYEKKINLLSLEEYVCILCDFLERTPSNVVILRLVSTADSNYLIAPLWINQTQVVKSLIEKELKERNTFQGYLYRENEGAFK